MGRFIRMLSGLERGLCEIDVFESVFGMKAGPIGGGD